MRGRFSKSHGSSVSFFAFQDVITGTTGFLIIITIFLALNLDEVIGTTPDADPHAALTGTLQDTLAEIVKLKKQTATAMLSPLETEETLRRMIDELERSIERLSPGSKPDPSKKPVEESLLDKEIRLEKEKLLALLDALKKLLPDATDKAAAAESKLAALESELKKVQSRLQQSLNQENVLRLIPEKSTTNKVPVLVVVSKEGFRILPFDGSKALSVSSVASMLEALGSTFPPAQHYIVIYFKPSGSRHFEDVTEDTRKAGYEIGYDLIPEHIQLEPATSKP
ncbi:hypothetical protein [Prosthecobacter sp.]|uniref:hypothetical protein n=1 Tax=Prosthecobacter sp. TaxID=1965333 RepID=UPI003782DD51